MSILIDGYGRGFGAYLGGIETRRAGQNMEGATFRLEPT